MKSKKLPKLVLNTTLLEDEFFEECTLLGIVCPFAPHQFIHHLNIRSGFHFTREHEFEVEVNAIVYPVYYVEERIRLTEHVVFVNRREKNYLLPELTHIDYIWLIKSSSYCRSAQADVLELLKSWNYINYAFPIDPDSLKMKQYLVL